jgi:glycosyltransferase involved in cell wall biosynthesis
MKHNKIQQQDILVSIGFPVYNGETFIKQAIESLLGQSHKNIELIISDNASTDNTSKICKQYIAKDPRIRYLQQPSNKGAIANFQIVLDESVGEYFMWAACDDYWESNWVETLIAVLLENPTLAGAIGMITLVDEKEKEYNKHKQKNSHTYPVTVKYVCGKKSGLSRLFTFNRHRNDMAIYGLFRKKLMYNLIIKNGPFSKKLHSIAYPIVYHLIFQGGYKQSEHSTMFRRIHNDSCSATTRGRRRDSLAAHLNHIYLSYKQLRAANASIIMSVTFTLYLFIYLSLVWIKYVFKSIFNSQF